MITFLYGPPGSGKTHTVLNEMKRDSENGIRSFLIVPEQETVALERRALTVLPPSAQLRMEVLNFSRLANRVFRQYGGLSYHYIDRGSKAFLMWKTLSELSSSFEFFDAAAASDPSLSEWLLAAISEMKASCVTPPMLDRTAEALDDSDPLKKKLRDLSLLYASYTGLIGESYDDSADDLAKLSSLLSEHDFFRGTHVYVDSFTSYTAEELRVIELIARQADALTVTFPAPAPNAQDLHLASVTHTSDRLTRLLEGQEIRTVTLRGNHRVKSESLSILASNLWRLDLTKDALPVFPADTHKHIRLSVSDSVYSEAEDTAHTVLSLIRKGYRYRDITVILRDASASAGILDFVFEKYGIPYFFSEKEDLISLPPMKLLLSALRVVSGGFALADVISYLKSGLTDATMEDIDLFSEYVTTWKLSGESAYRRTEWDMNPDGYTGDRSKRGDAVLKAANRILKTAIPPLLTLLDTLNAAETVQEQCLALKAFLGTLSLEEKLECLAADTKKAGRRKTADIYERLYPFLLEILDKIDALSPEGSNEALSARDLENAIRIWLRSAEIGTIPTAVDEITIGSANMIRTQNIRCAILLGLCEGEFPAKVEDSGLFSGAERARLSALDLELSQGYDFRSSDELLYVSRAVSAPSELLILSTHMAGVNGEAARPSMPFLRAKFLLSLSDEDILHPSDLPVIDRILSPRLSLEYYPALKNSAAGEALRRLYTETGYFPSVASIASQPISEPKASVTPETAQEVFEDRMRLSQSKLERFVKCPFSFYCEYVLSLRTAPSSEFGAADSGNFIHRVLECFFRAAIEGGSHTALPAFSRKEIERIADETIASYEKEILPPSLTSELSKEDAGRLAHLYKRLRALSVMMIENILEEFSESDFVPRFFELKIGGADAPAPLVFTLKDGSTLTLPGIIDRVDLCKKDGKLYIRIVDYKTGSKEFSLADLSCGINTQMLIYLFTLAHAKEFFQKLTGEADPTVVPAGALYHSSALSAVELDTYPDSGGIDVRSEAEKGFRRSGVLPAEDDLLHAMHHSLSNAFLPGVAARRSAGSSTSAAYVPLSDFKNLESTVKDTVCRIANTMRDGHADADPFVYKGKDPCTYCSMRAICRLTADRDED